MKRQIRPRNARLTTTKDRRKQFIIESVVKRRKRASLASAGRILWRVAKVAIVAAFVGGLYWGATEGYKQLFWENPDYALKEVRIQTNGSLTRDEVVKTAGFEIGKNIYSYKLATAREKLMAIPQVADVEIRRYLPDRIEVAVTERKPIAWVSTKVPADFGSAERSHMIDAAGLVFEPKRVPPEYRTLPVISGFDLADIEPGKPIQSAEMDTSLDLLRHLRETGDFHVQMIDISKGWCLVATDQRGMRVTFGLDDLEEQLARLAIIQREAVRYGQELRTVNVMVARNVPVTFVPPSTPELNIDAELLGEAVDPVPKAVPIGEGKSASSTKAKKSSAPPAKKSEPAKTKETPKRESESLLRPFRRA